MYILQEQKTEIKKIIMKNSLLFALFIVVGMTAFGQKKVSSIELELALNRIKNFRDSVEYSLVRQEIGEKMLSVYDAPWQVSKKLWDNCRFWVTPEDVDILFDAATNSQIFSSYMFDLAAMTAIDMYRDGYSQNYQEIIVLIEQAHKYEPKMADNAIKKTHSLIKRFVRKDLVICQAFFKSSTFSASFVKEDKNRLSTLWLSTYIVRCPWIIPINFHSVQYFFKTNIKLLQSIHSYWETNPEK